jgi:hypothetical protein
VLAEVRLLMLAATVLDYKREQTRTADQEPEQQCMRCQRFVMSVTVPPEAAYNEYIPTVLFLKELQLIGDQLLTRMTTAAFQHAKLQAIWS